MEEKKYPKVLVCAPTYAGKDYIFDRWYKLITNLTYPNYDWLVVDNSKNFSYVSLLRRRGYRKIVHIPRGINTRQALARSMMYCKRHALENGYDYIMSIETDLLPPKDIIERLLAHDKRVVGAIYEIGLEGSKDSPRRLCLYGLEPDTSKSDGKLLNLVPVKMGYDMVHTGLVQVTALGLGCVLIKRDVLEEVDFTWTDRFVVHSDMLFYRDLWERHIPVYADTDILVYHENVNWAFVKDI